MVTPKYQRVVLKLSEGVLTGDAGFGIKPPVIKGIIQEIKEIHELGVEVAIVVDGGNIWRRQIGVQVSIEHAQAGYMGMLTTVMNALALQDTSENVGIPTRVQTPIETHQIAEPYIRRKAKRRSEGGRIVVFTGDTGNPYFSTNTTAALHAAEIGTDTILMAKNNVDGVYFADPKVDANAVKFEELTHLEIIAKGLQVMDSTTSLLSMDNDTPLLVSNLNKHGNIRRAILGEDIGTTVKEK